MKILKHSSGKKYIFIPVFQTYFETYTFDLKKNKIKYEYIDIEKGKSLQTDLNKQIKVFLKKGYVLEELPETIINKAEAFTKHLVLEKKYSFILKNSRDILKSHFSNLSLKTKQKDKEYFLYYFNEELGFQSLNDHFSKKIRSEFEYVDAHKVTTVFQERLHMLFYMGFEFYTEAELRTLVTKKSFDTNIDSNAPFVKVKDSTYLQHALGNNVPCDMIYMRHHYYRENLTLKTDCYYIKDDEVVFIDHSYNITATTEQIDELFAYIKDINEKSENFGEQLSSLDFHKKFSTNLPEPENFKIPQTKEVSLSKLALSYPEKNIAFENILSTPVSLNSLYFYANTEAENPLDWKVSFVVLKNLEKRIYVCSKVFPLKQFNKAYKAIDFEEFEYNSDQETYFKKAHKKYKKADLKPISTAKIFEILSSKTIDQLVNQEVIERFETDMDYYKEVVEVFNNYANIRLTNNEKEHYLQFFGSDTERENWLGQQNKSTVKLYPQEVKSLLKFDESVKSHEILLDVKNRIIKDYGNLYPFSNYEIEKINKTNFEIKENWHHANNFKLNQNKSIYIKGDFTVNGTLYLAPNKDYKSPYFIVDGTLKAKNIIVERGFEFFFAQNIEVENIVVMANNNEQKFRALHGNIPILLHTKALVSALKPQLNYIKEVSVFSQTFTELDIRELKEDVYYFNCEKIYDLMVKEAFTLPADFETALVDFDTPLALEFISMMKNWGTYYHHLAGCDSTKVYEDHQIVGNAILPDAGDWVVYDTRGNSGTYGYSHEDASIVKVKVKKPEKFDINYDLKPKKLKVSATDLMYRYQWISNLFTSWAHRKEVTPYQYWENVAQLNADYQNEKSSFHNDPHLALYWLIHFGLCQDNRYAEVKQNILTLEIDKKLTAFNQVFSFFNKYDAYANIKLSDSYTSEEDKEELEDIFLIRRAYLIWNSQSYHYRGGENSLEQWWTSVTLYPKLHKHQIRKIRWFGNNLQKYNNWGDFEEYIKNKNTKEVHLLSYVLALNENSENNSVFANQFLDELEAGKDLWGMGTECLFAQKMIWELRDVFTDKIKLKSLVDYYFRNDKVCVEYEDICTIFGDENPELALIRKEVEILKSCFEGFENEDSDAHKKKYYKKIKAAFDKIEVPFF